LTHDSLSGHECGDRGDPGERRGAGKLRSFPCAAIQIPEVVRAELLFGCLKSQDPERERRKVDHVIAPFAWLPFAGAAVEHYADIRASLERVGQVIGPNDLLIAATARSAGAIPVTSNLDEFQRVPGLVVEDWC